MRKKIISCILALAMMFGVLQGTGVPVKADPGSTESNTVKINAGLFDKEIEDDEVSQRIIQTFDAMIAAGSRKVLLYGDYESYKTYYVSIIGSATSELHNFEINYDKNYQKCTVCCNSTNNISAFESTLDCSEASGEGLYSEITFCTYVGVFFYTDFGSRDTAYYSKGIDGTAYTSEDYYYPNENGDVPYDVPYGGTLEDIVEPEFVCFPEVTWEGKKFYSWDLVTTDENLNEIRTKVDLNTTFTEINNEISLSWNHCHSLPASNDTENVTWKWGKAENNYTDTSVELLCTDTGCSETIVVKNTESSPNSVVLEPIEVINPTCTKDGQIVYKATAKHVENGTTYTYTDTKTVAGEKATGHKWEFDTSEANAVWNDDNTAVSITKTCIDTCHDSVKDGNAKLAVSSSKILPSDPTPASKCGEASKTEYTATFDSSVDPAIESPFTITKTVDGDILQHDWVYDTDNVEWEGNDNSGYTKATITKTCKNAVHEGGSEKIISTNIATETVAATATDNTEKTYYIATFNSSNDPNITNEFKVEKVVAKVKMSGCEFDVTSGVEWEKDVQGGYKSVTITKKYINSSTGAIEKTEPVKSTKIEEENTPATDCETSPKTTYTATFDSSVDPDINSEFTVTLDVAGDKLQHDWVFDKENAELSQDSNGRYLITIKKTCNNEIHKGTNPVSVTSDKVEVSTGPAIKCGEPTKIFYTATFDSEADSDITDAFIVQKVVEGPVLQHNWEYDTTNVVWATGNTSATITKSCKNEEHGDQTNGISVTSSKLTISSTNATVCEATGTIRYTITFDSTVDPDIKSSFSVYKDVENTRLLHNWQVSSYSSNASYAVKPDKVTINVICGRDSSHKETIVTDNITEAPGTDEIQKTYVYTGKTVDGQTITVSEKVYSHKSHAWDVKFIWGSAPSPLLRDQDGNIDIEKNKNQGIITVNNDVISVTKSALETALFDINVIAEATCTIGKEKVSLNVSVEKKRVGKQIQYIAKTVAPDGKESVEYRTFDPITEEIKEGKAGPEINNGGFTLEGLEEEYKYTGAPIKPAFSVVDNATGTTLANGTDYSVSFSSNTKIGVATIKVKGKGNYNKSNAEATFKIVDPKEGIDEGSLADLKGAKITAVSPKAFDYDGEAHFPETITLKLKGGSEVTYTGTDGENYVDAEGNALPAAVSFSGNVNKGTATVLLSGKNNGKGKATTVKKTFKINAVDLKAATIEDLTVTVEEETVAWAVKGAQPAVKVEYKGKELLAGQDYKVSYKNNKKVGTASVTIAGKGNYAKTRKDAASFAIEAFDLTEAEIIATTAAAGVKVTKVKVTILDKAGNVIPAGKLAVTVEGAAGAKLAAGETVTVKASAKGAELKESCSEEVTVQAGDLSKAKIKVNVKKTYTGEPIELTDDDMKLVTVTVAGNTLVYGEDFEITGYSNNIKKGSMVVTVVGKGEKYSGSKTFKVKIEPKPIGSGK